MHGPEQVDAHHLRHTARISLICLVHLRLQERLCVSRLDAHDWKVCFCKPVKEPLRQWPGLEANPFESKGRILEHPQQILRMARHLDLAANLPKFVDDANCSLF